MKDEDNVQQPVANRKMDLGEGPVAKQRHVKEENKPPSAHQAELQHPFNFSSRMLDSVGPVSSVHDLRFQLNEHQDFREVRPTQLLQNLNQQSFTNLGQSPIQTQLLLSVLTQNMSYPGAAALSFAAAPTATHNLLAQYALASSLQPLGGADPLVMSAMLFNGGQLGPR